ncbi:MAG: hypothetical protein HY916_09050 [Desulfovibrio sp.]|nr:hypothetical protein [Desulfovibrio sp.]
MAAKDVAKVLGLDVRTVKKYHVSLGGVWVAGRLRFFENRIRGFIDANGDHSSGHSQVARGRQDRGQDSGELLVRQRPEGRTQGNHLGAGQKARACGSAELASRADALGLGRFIPGGRAAQTLHENS